MMKKGIIGRVSAFALAVALSLAFAALSPALASADGGAFTGGVPMVLSSNSFRWSHSK